MALWPSSAPIFLHSHAHCQDPCGHSWSYHYMPYMEYQQFIMDWSMVKLYSANLTFRGSRFETTWKQSWQHYHDYEVTGDPLHSRALAHSCAQLFTQPCPHCSHSRALGEQWARLCVFTLQGCVQAARLCRGSPVEVWGVLRVPDCQCSQYKQAAHLISQSTDRGWSVKQTSKFRVTSPLHCHV